MEVKYGAMELCEAMTIESLHIHAINRAGGLSDKASESLQYGASKIDFGPA